MWKLVAGSLAGGLGATLAFSVAIYGVARFVDLRREGHLAIAVAFGLLGLVALAAVGAGVAFGVSILTDKG